MSNLDYVSTLFIISIMSIGWIVAANILLIAARVVYRLIRK